jgi:hypothetical protein
MARFGFIRFDHAFFQGIKADGEDGTPQAAMGCSGKTSRSRAISSACSRTLEFPAIRDDIHREAKATGRDPAAIGTEAGVGAREHEWQARPPPGARPASPTSASAPSAAAWKAASTSSACAKRWRNCRGDRVRTPPKQCPPPTCRNELKNSGDMTALTQEREDRVADFRSESAKFKRKAP